MVRAKHVDQLVKAAFDFVKMISNVGCKIGPATVGFLDGAVNVVAMRSGLEQGLFTRLPTFRQLAFRGIKVPFVDQALSIQIIQRRLDLPCAV